MFEIRLFGPIEILKDGERVSGFRSQKTLALLAYLIVEERPLAREFLAGVFWPDVSQSKALGHLRRALYNLTSLLPDCLDVDRRTVHFDGGAPAVIDVRRFRELAAQEERGALEEAAALARAPFLEGVYLSACPEFEAWATAEQEQWGQAAAEVLERLVVLYGEAGDDEAALPYARRLVRFDRWREANHRRLMLLLARSGRREEALAQYERCRQLLQEELGLSPSAETAELAGRMRNAPAVRHNLPPQPTPFVGREDEVATLQGMLARPAVRLVTIVGPGGAGKTRLALELAQRLASRFLEGVWAVDLTSVPSTEQLATALANALEALPQPQVASRDRLLAYVREKELLFVLDNFEHLVEGAELLAEILQMAPDVRMLVTSRRALQLREEHLFELGGLPAPPAGEKAPDPAALRAYDAVRFLEEAVRRYRPGFELGQSPEAVAAICRLVLGSPLALELAAASSRARSLEEIAAAVAENVGALRTTLRNVPERHRSVRAAFDHSWRLLSSEEKGAFLSLAVFQGGLTAEAASAVAGVSPETLQGLVAHSLLRMEDGGRYVMHDLLHQYAGERLAAEPTVAQRLREAHAAYYSALASREGARLDGDEGPQARSVLAAEEANVLAAWEAAMSGCRWDLMERALDGLTRFLRHRGDAHSGVPLLEEALEVARQAPKEARPSVFLEGRLQGALARLLVFSGRNDEGLEAARRAQDLAHDGEDGMPKADGMRTVAVDGIYAEAMALFNQGDPAGSRAAAERGLALAQASGFAHHEALLMNMAGRTWLENDGERAQAAFERTLALARANAYRRLEISAGINLSLIDGTQGRYEVAAGRLEEALALAEEYGYRELLPIIHLNAGTMALQRGRYEEGRRHYEAALDLYRRSGDRSRVGSGYFLRGVVAAESGDFMAAERDLDLALTVYREVGARLRETEVQFWMAEVQRALGEYGEAQAALAAAQRLVEETGTQTQQLTVYWRLAGLAVEIGDFDAAGSYLEEAEERLREVQPVEEACRVKLTRSRLWEVKGELEGAGAAAEEALALVRGRNARLEPACTVRLAQVRAAAGEWAAAGDLFEEALAQYGALRQEHLAVEARAGLAEAALALGDMEAARGQVDAVLERLDEGGAAGFPGVQEPLGVYLACYRVLRALGDGRAAEVLVAARAELQRRAATLDGAARPGYLQNPPTNRALLEAGDGQRP